MPALIVRLRGALAALLLALSLPAAAGIVGELPPVDSVFVLSAQATAANRIEVRWAIADGYYLYRHRISAQARAGLTDTVFTLPEGEPHHDEFFGDVQTYRRQLVGVLTGTPVAGAQAVALTVKYQGCADAGVCYPPQTRTLTVALPTASTDAAPLLGRGSGRTLLQLADSGAAAAPLPPEQAFQAEAIALDGNTLLLRLTPAPGYYLYRDKLAARLEAGPGLAATLPPADRLPKATPYKDAHFGDVAVYFEQVEFPLPVTRTRTDAARGSLVVDLQGCQTDGICYPPMTRRLAVSLPAGRLSAQAAPAAALDANADANSAPRVTPSTTPVIAAAPPSRPASVDDAAPPPTPSLWLALLLALIGGLSLNLMPCVLPVLSLKALSLVSGGASRQRARQQALAYTAGVLLSMLTLGALVLALRHAGLALGWGFQLQQPLVLAVLALVMFVLGLSLSGVWQAQLALGAGASRLLQGDTLRADLLTGVLAVVLATPCTAPFMGAALAYAFTGPLTGALLVFLMLGLGLALPFLLIGFIPALARRLPRPGAWMETFKQLLAFPLYATAAWLVWVLARLRGADAVGLWLAAAILLALAAWTWTRGTLHRRWRWLTLAALLAALWPLAQIGQLTRPQMATTPAVDSPQVAWSEQALADLRAQGRVVFVDITADWCVSCKANEKTVLSTRRFLAALQQANAVYMVGDYTDVDPALTAYLQRYRAVGVPLYVVYPRNGGPGRVLPTLLTPGLVEAALREAAR
ncbi:MAG: protein-disulfide reductase DsbD [Thermomonas hydrothermalis]|uniref:protein-disulfide reductase DsbD family protein n=1 Tax=Thermomonas hydrothermalis TaxID=213588 RepID=UPI002352ECFE|nr:protein-disulfide reductase DsbD [Thermomonas hydrothermalis]MCL6619226.1 protein-disulfide reductase DsbD [Thermomonas hydrothermalis]